MFYPGFWRGYFMGVKYQHGVPVITLQVRLPIVPDLLRLPPVAT